jgi:hypothetical protein
MLKVHLRSGKSFPIRIRSPSPFNEMVIRSFLNQNFFAWNERGFSEKNYLTSGTLYNQPKVRCDLLLILEYLIFAIAALGDDPELEPSWTAISQSNQEWFASEYLPTIRDIDGEEKPVHIRDPTKMSAGERWACLEQWYRIGHLQMLAWKPRTIPDSLSPLPSEECWWHSAFPGKQSRIRSGRRKQLGTRAPESQESQELIAGTLAPESRESQESVPELMSSQSRESWDLVPPFHTSSSQSNLPPQPYSARTALARVPSVPTAAEVGRIEGHARYQQGLEQRRINREIRRATRQGAPAGQSVKISQRASEPDATPPYRSTASSGRNEATRMDGSFLDKQSASPRQLRKRKRNVVISDSERAESLENSPGPSNYSGQPTRDSTPVPRSTGRKGRFVILVSPVRHPTKSIKRRLGN